MKICSEYSEDFFLKIFFFYRLHRNKSSLTQHMIPLGTIYDYTVKQIKFPMYILSFIVTWKT